ncbi:MAG: hypothetical protein IJM76_05960 [Lachnospiraceae bacterium]|nr:hypothetical protein [Lachnospiraceae bacterium]
MRELSVNTGAVKVPVKDEFGEVIGEIRFIPTDADILRRYPKVAEFFREFKVPENAGDDDLIALSDKIKEQFDFLLNGPVSDGLFAKCSPLTPLADGTLYCACVLDAIGDLILDVFKERAEKLKKVEEATKEYD